MKIQLRSIRFRLTAWYALILTAGLALFSIFLWFEMRERLLRDIHRDLNDRSAGFESFIRNEAKQIEAAHLVDELEEYSAALPAGQYLELRNADGSVLFRHNASTKAQWAGFEVARGNLSGWGNTYTYELGSSRAPMHRALDLLGDLLLMLVPAVILISVAGGSWLSKRALRPVDDLTLAARDISIENLGSRLPVPDTGDELERLATVWNSTLARLDTAVTTLSQFAADASHELRTPLAVIRTSAELALRRERSPESYRQSLAQVAAEAERMTQLVEDLLFLAHRSAPDMPMSPVDLRALLNDIASEVRELSEIQVITDSGDSTISGNPGALRRLFLLLLDNAFKYSRPQGPVILTLTTAEYITVSVQDFGIGIESSELPHIFRRFYRADKSRTGGGHGLGLSLGESIAVAHNARIEVVSEPGKGSVFTVIFPRRGFSQPALPTPQPVREVYSGS